ncbi:hypothetical protein WKK05_37140 (plasmid) [Nostoc sp. UHCC 0302]
MPGQFWIYYLLLPLKPNPGSPRLRSAQVRSVVAERSRGATF